ncbi:hypothetical protein [Hippea alviniae]|uniref:hypothetical protein n=1 Tax=Hippea alviniae TaxID=1279027 RepID=UPI0003B52C84|nr:hypothetical protein [Hippea alviniae]
MAKNIFDPFESYGETSETTYEDVKEFVNTVLDKAPHYAIIEELESIAEYVVLIEKILDENGIDFSDEALYSKKAEDPRYVDEQKKLFLLHFAGKIVRKEGSVV